MEYVKFPFRLIYRNDARRFCRFELANISHMEATVSFYLSPEKLSALI